MAFGDPVGFAIGAGPGQGFLQGRRQAQLSQLAQQQEARLASQGAAQTKLLGAQTAALEQTNKIMEEFFSNRAAANDPSASNQERGKAQDSAEAAGVQLKQLTEMLGRLPGGAQTAANLMSGIQRQAQIEDSLEGRAMRLMGIVGSGAFAPSLAGTEVGRGSPEGRDPFGGGGDPRRAAVGALMRSLPDGLGSLGPQALEALTPGAFGRSAGELLGRGFNAAESAVTDATPTFGGPTGGPRAVQGLLRSLFSSDAAPEAPGPPRPSVPELLAGGIDNTAVAESQRGLRDLASGLRPSGDVQRGVLQSLREILGMNPEVIPESEVGLLMRVLLGGQAEQPIDPVVEAFLARSPADHPIEARLRLDREFAERVFQDRTGR